MKVGEAMGVCLRAGELLGHYDRHLHAMDCSNGLSYQEMLETGHIGERDWLLESNHQHVNMCPVT